MSGDTDIRGQLAAARRVVVKVGSAQVTADGAGLAHERIRDWSEQIDALWRSGVQVLLVSSGAVAEGVHRLGGGSRPETIVGLQAAAAVGQMGLIQAWERAFAVHERQTALILLTREDLADRERYLNARATLTQLWNLGVVPVVNENDTVATEEIKVGDNDTLAALVTNLLQADALVILTDQGGLYTADPRTSDDAVLVSEASALDPMLADYAGARGGRIGIGGMATKLGAARLAARSGAHTLIASGREPRVIHRLLAGEPLGSLLFAKERPLDARKRWIADQLKPRGALILDEGATRALKERGVSLLPVGVVAVEGEFQRGDLVRLLDPERQTVAQGLANYSADEARRLQGVGSSRIEAVLGYSNEEELVHRDNLVVLSR